MKIKVFKFEVSNASSGAWSDEKETMWYKNAHRRLITPSKIENEIDNFCEGKEIIDIKVNTVDIHYHNNGRGNTIELWYTILYK